MRVLLFLAIAGALGTLSRYGLSSWVQQSSGSRFPYGTLVVNVLGCLLLGFVMQTVFLNEATPISRPVRLAMGTGFLGAFTTFSTFGYETMHHLEQGEWQSAIFNILANLMVGLLAIWLGLLCGKTFFTP